MAGALVEPMSDLIFGDMCSAESASYLRLYQIALCKLQGYLVLQHQALIWLIIVSLYSAARILKAINAHACLNTVK